MTLREEFHASWYRLRPLAQSSGTKLSSEALYPSSSLTEITEEGLCGAQASSSFDESASKKYGGNSSLCALTNPGKLESSTYVTALSVSLLTLLP